jgi:hypothetical protein
VRGFVKYVVCDGVELVPSEACSADPGGLWQWRDVVDWCRCHDWAVCYEMVVTAGDGRRATGGRAAIAMVKERQVCVFAQALGLEEQQHAEYCVGSSKRRPRDF